jgi:hypothetical protein
VHDECELQLNYSLNRSVEYLLHGLSQRTLNLHEELFLQLELYRRIARTEKTIFSVPKIYYVEDILKFPTLCSNFGHGA